MSGADSGPLRRVALLAFVLVATTAATQLLTYALGADGLSTPELGILPLFALTLAWICYAFATALIGFLLHLVGEPGGAPGARLRPPPAVRAAIAASNASARANAAQASRCARSNAFSARRSPARSSTR